MDGIDNAELARRLLEIPLFREIYNTFRGQSGPVDWTIAGQIADAVSGSGRSHPGPASRDVDEFHQACRVAELAVVGHSGLEPTRGVTDVRLAGRSEWARHNLESLRPLMERLAGKLSQNAAGTLGFGPALPLLSAVAPFLMGAQTGMVVGYLSHRSLGSWDICLPEPVAGSLWFDYPNILEVERELGVEARDFRMWLAVHDVSHELLFQSVDWLRPHLLGLIHQYIDAAEIDASQLSKHLSDLNEPSELAGILQRPEDLFPLLRSPAQETIVEKILGLTSTAEGYSYWILRRAGLGLTDSFERIQEGMTRRRAERSSPERMIEKMLGLDLGNEQHRRGQRFIEAIAAEDGLDRLWDRPENLPDVRELNQPREWLARMS